MGISCGAVKSSHRAGHGRPSARTLEQQDRYERNGLETFPASPQATCRPPRPSPMLAAGSVRRPRRMKVLAPIAAAAAVIVIIAASVALPRLLTGSSPDPGQRVRALPAFPGRGDVQEQWRHQPAGGVGGHRARGDHRRLAVARCRVGEVAARGPLFIVDVPVLGLPVHADPVVCAHAVGPRHGRRAPGRLSRSAGAGHLAGGQLGRPHGAYTQVPLDLRTTARSGIITARTIRLWTIGGLTRTGAGNLLLRLGVQRRAHGRVRHPGPGPGDEVWVLPTGPRRAASPPGPGRCSSSGRSTAPGR